MSRLNDLRTDLRARHLTLDKKQGWLGGVCAGFARFWRIDPIWVRIVAVTSAFMFPQLAIAAYAACWLVLERG